MVQIKKDLIISKIKKEDLNSMHTEIHSLWYQVLLGKRDDWTIAEMYKFHKDLLWQMTTESVKHIANVDTLDTLQPLSEDKKKTPYVLSARGISKGYVPEKGKSALPKEWEDKIPKELRWWKRGLTGPKAIAVLKEIRRNILKKVEDKELNKLKEIENKEVKFALKRKWWKGPEVSKGLPVEHYEIRLDAPKFPFFKLNIYPLTTDSGISAIKSTGRKSEVMFRGKIPPGEEGNPNKKIPAFIDILDSNSCSIMEDSENLIQINFKGSKLKGSWIFKRTGPQSNIWLFSKNKIPKAKLDLWGESVSENESREIFFLHSNGIGASAIAKHLGRPVRRIYKVLG